MSDLISREALIKLLKDYGHSGDDDYIVEAVNTIPRITNAPVVGGEPVAYTDGKEDFMSVATYEEYKKLGFFTKCKTPLYTTPQQPQSVADALEEAAKLVEGITKYTQFQTEAHYQVTYSFANRIRALIKRNAEEGEVVGYVKAERNALNTLDKHGNVCMVMRAYLRGKVNDGDLLYTTPQQPQSVADALEEVIKLIQKYGSRVANPSASIVLAIRALIKRNAVKEGE